MELNIHSTSIISSVVYHQSRTEIKKKYATQLLYDFQTQTLQIAYYTLHNVIHLLYSMLS